MSRTRAPDDDAPPPPDADPRDAIATLRTGLARCRALVAEAHRTAREVRHESHTDLIATPRAAETVADAPAPELSGQLEALQRRIEHAQQARAAAAARDRDAHEAIDPPVFADAPDVPRVPRGVDPGVWDVLRAALADGVVVSVQLSSGAFRDPTPRTLTGRPALLEFDRRGRPHVTLVVRPGVTPRLLVATITWAEAAPSSSDHSNSGGDGA